MSSVQPQTETYTQTRLLVVNVKAPMPELVGLHTFRNMKTTKCCQVLEWLTKDMVSAHDRYCEHLVHDVPKPFRSLKMIMTILLTKCINIGNAMIDRGAICPYLHARSLQTRIGNVEMKVKRVEALIVHSTRIQQQ